MEFGCRISFVLSRTMTNYPTVSRSQKLSAWAACLPAVFDPSEVFLDGGRRRLPTRLWAAVIRTLQIRTATATAHPPRTTDIRLANLSALPTARAELGEGYCR